MFSSRVALNTLFAAAISLLWAAPLGATTMEELSFEEMAYIADLVAEATVSHNEVERTEGSVFLRTVTSLRLDRVIKGEAFEGERIDVLSLGENGEIILEMTDLGIVDGPGPDLLVFENPFAEWFEKSPGPAGEPRLKSQTCAPSVWTVSRYSVI